MLCGSRNRLIKKRKPSGVSLRSTRGCFAEFISHSVMCAVLRWRMIELWVIDWLLPITFFFCFFPRLLMLFETLLKIASDVNAAKWRCGICEPRTNISPLIHSHLSRFWRMFYLSLFWANLEPLTLFRKFLMGD